jgi:hypothetical protein
VHSPPELLGCESVELVVQAPVYTEYAIRLEAVLVDVVRERIDFRRPPRIIMRVGSEWEGRAVLWTLTINRQTAAQPIRNISTRRSWSRAGSIAISREDELGEARENH